MKSVLAVVLVLLAAGPSRATGPLHRWVEIGPGGVILARVITDDPQCPPLVVDGVSLTMSIRAAPTTAFAVTVCEATVPARAVAATVEGERLALPTHPPQRIVVIGDTGCRMEAPADFQACNDPAAWPIARIAAVASAWRPDLVIHLGDYHYRESPCPPGNPACADNPTGDTWPSWRADFFAPAAPLLRAAPWVVVRGNHELCGRAGAGWFRFLDPRPLGASCTDFTEPYVVPFGTRDLMVLDSSNAQDNAAPTGDVDRFAEQFRALSRATSANAWLLSHRPLWAVVKTDGQGLPTASGNRTLQAAAASALPPNVTLLIAGHVHLFEALAFSGGRPPGLVVGTGGTQLDKPFTAPAAGATLDGALLSAVRVTHRWGFVTLEPAGTDWLATVRDVDGAALSECRIAGASIACTP